MNALGSQAEPLGPGRRRAISNDNGSSSPPLPIGCRNAPVVAIPTDVSHCYPRTAFSSGLFRLISQQLIQPFSAHDPERCFTGKLSHHWITQAPTEINLANHLFHSRFQREGEPLLHRGGHAAAARFDSWFSVAFKQHNIVATPRQVGSCCSTSGSGPDDDHIAKPFRTAVQTLRVA